MDRWGRPIVRPSMSPGPADMHQRVTQGMPGSPAKGGLGMTLRNDIKGDLRVTELAMGGPAANGGQMRRGDIIAVIAGRNVRGMSVIQARDLIMGPEGSTVVLGVQRDSPGGGPGPGEFFEVSLTRASLPRGRSFSQSPAVNQSPMVHSGRRQPPMTTPTPSPYGGPYKQPDFSPAPHRLGATPVEPGKRAPVPINEAMCGIGVFIEASQNGIVESWACLTENLKSQYVVMLSCTYMYNLSETHTCNLTHARTHARATQGC